MKNFKFVVIVIIMFCFMSEGFKAQSNEWAEAILSGNDVEVAVSVYGTLGQKLNKDGSFDFGYYKNKNLNGYPTIHSFRATSLWMGGYDFGGSLKLASGEFFYPNIRQDFQAGLLSQNGEELPGSIEVFNKVWKVSRIEIENLRKDWADNQTIENTVSIDMKYWPGRGNPFFLTDLNFALPDQQLAPFFDRNQDGKYNIYDGDLPEASQTNTGIVFEELCWSAFHDNRVHTNSNGEILHAQVYASTFTTLCDDEHYINKTVFQDFTIISKNLEPIDSFFVGMWSNPIMFEMVSGSDTYMGTNIEQSSQFSYTDQALKLGKYAFSESVSILNQKLTSSICYSASGGNNPPIELNISSAFYNLLTGRWIDGAPIKPTGNGYDLSSTLPSTKYIFYDPPRQVGGFSMYQNVSPFSDLRMVGSSGNILLNPGESYNVTYAFSFHQDDDANAPDAHLKHVDKMYEEVPKIRDYYNSNFESCNPPAYCSGTDCVWPGDMDKNLQVDYRDLVYLAVGNGATGAKRNPLTGWNWYPQSADNWTLNLPGSNINYKNLDASGDGKLEWMGDELVILANKNKTSTGGPLNKPKLAFGQGIKLDRIFNITAKDTILKGGSIALVNINIGTNIDISDLAGVAFNISYDSWVFNNNQSNYKMFKDFQIDTSALKTYQFTDITDQNRRVNYESVWVRNDSQDKDPKGLMSRLLLRLRNDAYGNGGLDTTWIEIAGIRAVKTNGEVVSIGAMSIPVMYQSKTTVSTNELNIEGTILVYPNPLIGDRLNIETKETMLSYRIIDVLGREIVSQKLVAGTSGINLTLNPGIYSLGLLTPNGWVNQLLIKQ